MNLELLWQIFEKYLSSKFHEDPSRWSRVVPRGRTDRQRDRQAERRDEANSRFSQFCMCVYKVKFILLHSMTTRKCSRGVDLPIRNFGDRRGWVVNAKSRPLYPRVGDHIRIVQQAMLVSVLVWADTEDLTPLSGLEPRTVATKSTLSRPAPNRVMFRLLYPRMWKQFVGAIKQFSVHIGYVVVLEVLSQEQRNALQ